MERFILFVNFSFLTICPFCQGLNDSIRTAQVLAINTSSYKDARWCTGYIRSQEQFRKREFPLLVKKLISGDSRLTDSLWIVERFSDECYDCQSIWSEILYRDTLYTIKRNKINSLEYITSKVVFNDHLHDSDFNTQHHEIFEVKHRIENNKLWTSDALKYGIDGCDDGSHTFMTIISPTKSATSLYVRCWEDWYGKKIE
jgi:hypothetical protein